MKETFIHYLLSPISVAVRLAFTNSKWRKINKENFTMLKTSLSEEQMKRTKVGKFTYGTLDIRYYGSTDESISIGSYCSISDNVVFHTGGNHRYDVITTYPIRKRILKTGFDAISKGAIVIEDDVWIGYGTVILSGVTIGRGAVVGAGSVVMKDIPPYAIYVGSSIKKYRFCNEIIMKLMSVDYSHINHDIIKFNQRLFFEPIDEEGIERLLNLLSQDNRE